MYGLQEGNFRLLFMIILFLFDVYRHIKDNITNKQTKKAFRLWNNLNGICTILSTAFRMLLDEAVLLMVERAKRAWISKHISQKRCYRC